MVVLEDHILTFLMPRQDGDLKSVSIVTWDHGREKPGNHWFSLFSFI